MQVRTAIAWITVAFAATAVSCAREPLERSSVTAELASDESSGTEAPAPAQASPVPAQGPGGFDGGVSFPPLPSFDGGSPFPGPGPGPGPSPGGFDGGPPFAPILGELAEPVHEPILDGGVPEPIDLDAAVGPDVDGAVDPIEVDAGTAPQPM